MGSHEGDQRIFGLAVFMGITRLCQSYLKMKAQKAYVTLIRVSDGRRHHPYNIVAVNPTP